MLARRIALLGIVVVAAAATLAVSAPIASAHNGEDHGDEASATTPADALPPKVTTDPKSATGGGGNVGDPAPGAQPAAPGAAVELPKVDDDAAVADAAGADVAAQAVDAGIAAPVEAVSVPSVAKPASRPIVDGGGTGPTAAGAGAPAPGGELPFTGLGETLLLVVLAGMFVPLGVLAWSFARHGDARILRRHLAMPRFEWASGGAAASGLAGTGAPAREHASRFQWRS
jgi:hypothetical protein